MFDESRRWNHISLLYQRLDDPFDCVRYGLAVVHISKVGEQNNRARSPNERADATKSSTNASPAVCEVVDYVKCLHVADNEE